MEMKTNAGSKFFGLFFATVLLLGLSACGGDENPTTDPTPGPLNIDTTSDPATAEAMRKTQQIFYSIPSPIEMASILRKANASYDHTKLNDINNKEKYATAEKQALNLGIYGADLSYCSIFNENQETMFYLAATRHLAEKLGVMSAVDDATVDRIDRNLEDRDSMMTIISETFWTLDTYFKENDRDAVSALIVAGGWIEGLYLTTQLLDEDPDKELVNRVAEQKFTLDNLVSLLESYSEKPRVAEDLAGVLQDIRELDALYDGVTITREKTTTETDPESGMTVIGGDNKIEITTEQLMAIKDKTAELRTKYTE